MKTELTITYAWKNDDREDGVVLAHHEEFLRGVAIKRISTMLGEGQRYGKLRDNVRSKDSDGEDGVSYSGHWTLQEKTIDDATPTKGPYRVKLQKTPFNYTSPTMETFKTLDAILLRIRDEEGSHGSRITHIHNADGGLEFGYIKISDGTISTTPRAHSSFFEVYQSNDFKAAKARDEQARRTVLAD